MKKRLLLIALICGLMFSACAILTNVVRKPELKLKSVEFTSIDFTGLTLLSKVEVKNNFVIDVPLPKIDWDLLVIGNPFTKGIVESKGSLKSQRSTEVQFPVSFKYVDLIKAVTALNDNNARYKIKMTARIPIPELGDLTWPFEHEGKIPMMRVPNITVAAAPKVSITYGTGRIPVPTGGKVEFALNVKNNSNVAVTINDLSCVLKINNTSLPRGGVEGKPRINAGTTERIPFSFSLTTTDITNVGLTVLTGGSFSYSLSGNYKFGIPEFPLLNEVGNSFTLQ
jgi:LEA14-like dessication related protein